MQLPSHSQSEPKVGDVENDVRYYFHTLQEWVATYNIKVSGIFTDFAN